VTLLSDTVLDTDIDIFYEYQRKSIFFQQTSYRMLSKLWNE